MAFQHPGGGKDVQSRRSILQGLQQTKTRLQRLHTDDPSPRSSPSAQHAHPQSAAPMHVSSHRPPGPSMHPNQLSTTVMHPHHQASITPKSITTASPSPSDHSLLTQQQKAAMQQANSQSFGYFIPQSSFNGNIILPVLPRFNSNEELINN